MNPQENNFLLEAEGKLINKLLQNVAEESEKQKMKVEEQGKKNKKQRRIKIKKKKKNQKLQKEIV